MIEFKNVSFSYGEENTNNGIKNVNLKINAGELVLLCGESGCGKTTITRCINGLVPNYYEGNLEGEVFVAGLEVFRSELYEISKNVGSVFQNPRSQFFNVDTTDELAFGCENMGLPANDVCNRIGQVMGEFKIHTLIDRSLFELSGGEKQKIACASVSAMKPNVFVLDEPSSNLDIHSIKDLHDVIAKWKEQGKTIVVSEHRLYYLMDLADRVIYIKNGEIAKEFTNKEYKALTVDEISQMGLRTIQTPKVVEKECINNPLNTMQLLGFKLFYKKYEALNVPLLTLPKNEVVGIIGDNGAGKTTFARVLCGFKKNARGNLIFDNNAYNSKQRLRLCYMVMQDVNHQLFTESVLDEILLSMDNEEESKAIEKAEAILESLNLLEKKELHPMSLSGGEKQRVAIGSAIASSKEIIVFDEPTSGLDHRHMLEVSNNLEKVKAQGKSVFLISHDPELIYRSCTHIIFIENGTIKWSKPMNAECIKSLNQFLKIEQYV